MNGPLGPNGAQPVPPADDEEDDDEDDDEEDNDEDDDEDNDEDDDEDDDGWYDMAVVEVDEEEYGQPSMAPNVRRDGFQQLLSPDVLAMVLASVNDPKPCKAVKNYCQMNKSFADFCQDPSGGPFDAMNRALGWYGKYDTISRLTTRLNRFITSFNGMSPPIMYNILVAADSGSPKKLFRRRCSIKVNTDPLDYAEFANQIELGSIRPYMWQGDRAEAKRMLPVSANEAIDQLKNVTPLQKFPLKRVFVKFLEQKYQDAPKTRNDMPLVTENDVHWAIMVKRFGGTFVPTAWMEEKLQSE